MGATVGKYYAVTASVDIPGLKMPCIGRNLGNGNWELVILDESDLFPTESIDVSAEQVIDFRQLHI